MSLDDPAVTLVLTTQPEVLHSLDRKPGFKGRGLLARIAYTVPGNLMGLRKDSPAPLDPAVAAAYDTEISRLLDIDPPFGPMLERARRELRLDEGAQERVRTLMRSIEPRMGPGGDLEYMADWLGKYVGLVVRLAGLLHVTEWVSNYNPVIAEATFARAEKLGEFYLAHAIAGFDLMGTDQVTAGARHVLAWLRRKKLPLITARDIFEGVKGSSLLRTMKALSPALKLLVDTNWIRYAPAETRAGPGRMASTLYEIHPTVAFAEFAESPPTTADDVPATSNPDAVSTCLTCGVLASDGHECPAATSGATGGGDAS